VAITEGGIVLPGDNLGNQQIGLYLPDGNFYHPRGTADKQLLVEAG
jgi:hypothetical protein